MDPGTAWLVSINQQLQQTIIDMKKRIEHRPGLQHLFLMGCGFTEWLTQLFHLLDLSQLQQCRLVCSVWRDFIDSQVWFSHPHVLNYHRWTGQEEVIHQTIHCGGEVGVITSDNHRVYCAMKDALVVFQADTFLLETVLDVVGGKVWQLQAGRSVLVATTQSSVLVWSKQERGLGELSLLAKFRHGSGGEPYLNVDQDLIVVPGDSKTSTRVMMYSMNRGGLATIRDLDHKRFWVLGAQVEQHRVLTLSLLAFGTSTTREMKLWNILDGTCQATLDISGGVAGFPALRYPHAFLSTGRQGLEVWNIETREKIQTLMSGVPIYGYQLKHQFLFILDKHSRLKVMKLREVTASGDQGELWSRELTWSVSGPVTGTLPRIQVEMCRVLAVASTGCARDIIHVMTL